MSIITKPMLAGTLTDPDGSIHLDAIKYPVLATPKIDGIRALIIDGGAVSRTFKPISNVSIRERLEKWLPEGADGEILAGKTFSECAGNVARQGGATDFEFHWFDWVNPVKGLTIPYRQRIHAVECHGICAKADGMTMVKVLPQLIHNEDELECFESAVLDLGYEGAMLRDPDGAYKCGRSTRNEGLLLKLKRFLDSEAEVVGFEEKMHNGNEATKDAFGRTKRSSHRENLSPLGTLGALVVRDIKTGVQFNMAGFTAEVAADIWSKRKKLVGALAKYKYFPVGVKDAPRHPTFLGFRSKEDM